MDPNSLLLLDNKIYVLSAGNLCICVLQYNYDYILAEYFGQNKILELVCYVLWDAWTLTIFIFIFILDNKEAHDTAVTWQVTWCDIIGLEHGRRI